MPKHRLTKSIHKRMVKAYKVRYFLVKGWLNAFEYKRLIQYFCAKIRNGIDRFEEESVGACDWYIQERYEKGRSSEQLLIEAELYYKPSPIFEQPRAIDDSRVIH